MIEISTSKYDTVPSSLSALKNVARDISRFEASNETYWGIWRSPIYDYEDSFRHLLSGSSFAEKIQERRESGLGAFVVDFMGEGEAIRDLDVDGGVAVTLGDGRTEGQKRSDRGRNIEVIAGNVLDKSTWGRVDEFMVGNRINGFDLIFVRPVGGVDFIPQDNRLLGVLLSKLWSRLSPFEGEAYIEYDCAKPPWFKDWLKGLSCRGVDVGYDGDALKLVKYLHSPQNIFFR